MVATETRPQTTTESTARRRVFSGIQPSGATTLGNYLGAIKRWTKQQYQHQSIHSIVNLHAMTMPYDAADLRQRTLDMAAVLLACGIDPEVAILFAQGDVPEHTELTWTLSTSVLPRIGRTLARFLVLARFVMWSRYSRLISTA